MNKTERAALWKKVKTAVTAFRTENPGAFWGIVGFLAGFLTCWVL